MSYNVVIKKYKNSFQIKTYTLPIIGNKKKQNEITNQEIINTIIKKQFEKEIGLSPLVCKTAYSEYYNNLRLKITKKEIEKYKKRYNIKDYVKIKETQENTLNIESLKRSCKRSIQKMYDIAKSNNWDLFFTLTFDKEKIDRYNYDVCKKNITEYFSYIRKRYSKDLKYLGVPELHKDGAIHFHFLVSNFPINLLTDSNLKDKNGHIIYNVKNYNLGFSTATKVVDSEKCSTYICKYISKSIKEMTQENLTDEKKEILITVFGKKRYFSSRNVDRPTIEKIMIPTELLNDLNEIIQEVQELEKYIKTYNYEIQTPYKNYKCDVLLTEIKNQDLIEFERFTENYLTENYKHDLYFVGKIIILRQILTKLQDSINDGTLYYNYAVYKTLKENLLAEKSIK